MDTLQEYIRILINYTTMKVKRKYECLKINGSTTLKNGQEFHLKNISKRMIGSYVYTSYIVTY